MRKRNNAIKLRLDDDELRYLNDSVKRSYLNRESYLRALIKGRPLIERPPMDLIETLREIQQIQNNLHTIAFEAHQQRKIDEAAYWENMKSLDEVKSALLQVMFGE